ncbi:hypothetical protein [Virgisporangium aurantiacum]|uniref:Uncharacterized protein n=1 Tax=Virgisporangium aurantiacum TaxID=175570 RepID=A0A8J3ZH42_9ACTN|nr:hypothetical protein Vau01_115380 [Virgisporangium aurantiacum]
MIDRLVHRAEVLTLTGDSYRTRRRRDLLKETAPTTKAVLRQTYPGWGSSALLTRR